MCDTVAISKRIISLSKRSYSRRIALAASVDTLNVGPLKQLVNQLSQIINILKEQWSEIGEREYSMFGSQLDLLISTLISLSSDIRRANMITCEVSGVIDRLEDCTSDLQEINSDIVNFRVKLPKHPDYKMLIAQASALG